MFTFVNVYVSSDASLRSYLPGLLPLIFYR